MKSFHAVFLLAVCLPVSVFAADLTGKISSENSDRGGYTGGGSGNLTISNNGSVKITAESGGYMTGYDNITVTGDFLHNGQDGNGGSLTFTGNSAKVQANHLIVVGNFSNGDGSLGWDLELKVADIDIDGQFLAKAGSIVKISGQKFHAGEFNISGGVYMGANSSSSIVHIENSNAGDVYTIKSDKVFNVVGNIKAETGTLKLELGGVSTITGNIGGNIWFDTSNTISINGNVESGANLYSGNYESLVAENCAFDAYGTKIICTGEYLRPKRMDLSISGIYYFNDNSKLQLVLNSAVAFSKNTDPYTNFNPAGTYLYEPDNPDTDALIHVKQFNGSEVANTDTRINILVDMKGIENAAITKIRLIETESEENYLGKLSLADVWFYYDDNNDGNYDRRESYTFGLKLEGADIVAFLGNMQLLAPLTEASGRASENEIKLAGAVDDLVLTKMHAAGMNDELDKYDTSALQQLFPISNVYHDLFTNGSGEFSVIDIMTLGDPGLALDFVRGIGQGLESFSETAGNFSASSHIMRAAAADEFTEDFIWKKSRRPKIGWARFGTTDNIMNTAFGFDWRAGDFVLGANAGYNSLDFGAMTGSTFNFGLYGLYNADENIRWYSNLNFMLHSAKIAVNQIIIGATETDISATDVVADFGLLHRISGTYVTGRAHLAMGLRGGFDAARKYHGQDFMKISSVGGIIAAPGYEISVGKDFMLGRAILRPIAYAGLEYDILSGGMNDIKYIFIDGSKKELWAGHDADGLWLRWGLKLEADFLVGWSAMLGYESISGCCWSANNFKLAGKYRF